MTNSLSSNWNSSASSSVTVNIFRRGGGVRLHFVLGHYFVFLDVTSFAVNLQYRRDASFYLCGEVSRFVSLLCSRVYTPDTVPLENAWFLLLRFQTSEGTFLHEDENSVRLKLSNHVGTASRARAEGIHFGKKSERPAIQATAGTVKTAFVKDSQQYVQFLINEVLKRVGLTSNIAKGLAAFDPFIMFKRPMDVALKHFDMLYNTFALRSWVPSANESLCRDQYMQLLDHLRTSYCPNFDLTSTSSDLIEFLVGLEFLQDRAHLFHLFKLCCLCAPSVSSTLPDVTCGTVTTAGRQNRFTDVILPCQSYLANVRDSVSFCSNDDNLASFSLLSSSFGRSAFAEEYDPWTYVDTFGRSKIYKSLLASCRIASSAPEKISVQIDPGDASSVADDSAVKAPSSKKRRKMELRASRSSASSATVSPQSSITKN